MTVRHPHRRVDLTADPRFNSNAFDAAALFGSQCAVSSQALDTTGLVAGMFDYLGLEELIDTYIGKAGSHVKVTLRSRYQGVGDAAVKRTVSDLIRYSGIL